MKTATGIFTKLLILAYYCFFFGPFVGCAPTLPPEVSGPQGFHPISPVEWKLPNGMTLLYLEDPELPLVQGGFFWRGGTYLDSLEERGAMSAMGDELRSGGTLSLAPDALDLELERLAASISTKIGSEFGSVTFRAFNKDFESVLEIFSDVIRRPRFDRNRLQLWKGQELESIRRRGDDPVTIARIAFNEVIFPNSVYGQSARTENIARIDTKLLKALHRKVVRPSGGYLVISGNVSFERVKRAVWARFIDWTGPSDRLVLPELPKSRPAGIYFIEKPYQQTTVLIGEQGVPRLTKYQYAISLFNEIFGVGGFMSRLLQEIRVKRGLAYSTYGGIFPNDPVGKNFIVLQTKAESTGEAVEESLKVLYQLQNEEVSQKELDLVRSGVESSFVFNFDSRMKTVSRVASLGLLGYPANYDDTFLEEISRVSPKEVLEAAKDSWESKNLKLIVVGSSKARESLEKSQLHGSRLAGLPWFPVSFSEGVDF